MRAGGRQLSRAQGLAQLNKKEGHAHQKRGVRSVYIQNSGRARLLSSTAADSILGLCKKMMRSAEKSHGTAPLAAQG